jgi:homoserine dehydrogenase
MKQIAVIGFGVVGGGVVSLVEENAAYIRAAVGDDVRVKYILDLRDFPDSPYRDRVIHDAGRIWDDPEIALVVETMGGVRPAAQFTLEALSRGKHVVTSNKELVAREGIALTREAHAHGAAYLYEAAVGGGIPLLRPIRTALTGDRIESVCGILNGTTNYILTRMRDCGAAFGDALAEAQKLGYAERDPSADIDGLDAQRKMMILTAAVTGVLVGAEDVFTETTARLTVLDIDAAQRLGGAVRLIGMMRREGDGISVSVCPRIVPGTHPLSHVDDVYNGICVSSRLSGDVMFYGRGAGRFPTAGAVVSDVIAALSGACRYEANRVWSAPPAGFVRPFSELTGRMYVRIGGISPSQAAESASALFGDCAEVPGTPEGKTEFVTPAAPDGVLRQRLARMPGVTESAIRLL